MVKTLEGDRYALCEKHVIVPFCCSYQVYRYLAGCFGLISCRHYLINRCVLAEAGVEIQIPSGTYLICSKDAPALDGVAVRDRKDVFHMFWEILEEDGYGTEAGLRRLLADACPADADPDYCTADSCG